MGTKGEERVFTLGPDLLGEDQRISAEENWGLEITFTAEELDEVLSSMKVDTSPGPDGLPILFFKRFWNLVQPYLLNIINGFALG
jgi:hypothetical protein